jgi:ABC-type branched-subunit amino acid transport system substrate-binding protein
MRLLQEAPENEQVAQVIFAAAEAHYRAREFEAARKSYRELLARFPLFDQADVAKYHLALSQLELGEARDALQTLGALYPRLSEEERPNAAIHLARASELSKQWGEAVRWNAEIAGTARDEASRDAALARALMLIDQRVPFVEVARLAQEIPPNSAAWPLIQFKLAKILAHLRDRVREREVLESLLAQAPNSTYAPEARQMLARLDRRLEVKPDTIGLVLPLSGKYKAFGETVLDGIKLALSGSNLKIVTRDTAGDAAQARSAVAELAEDEQVLAIIGPVLSAESENAAAESELQETPILTLTRAEGITAIGPHVFRNMLTNSAQAAALVDYAVKVKGFKRFAVLYPNIPYGNELANYFWDAVEAQGGEMRGAEGYDADQTTFGPVVKKLVGRYYLEERDDFGAKRREIIERIKDPFRQRKALEDAFEKLPPIIDFDALFIPDYYKNVGLVAPALAVEDVITNACDRRDLERIAKTQGKEQRDIKTVQLFGANGWNFPELVERGGKFVQCSIFVDGFFANSDRKETRAFVDAFRKATGRAPSLLEASAYDTAKIVRQIVEQQRPATRSAFREALLKVKDFPGATGSTTFNEKREAAKPLFMLTIDRNGIAELDLDDNKS